MTDTILWAPGVVFPRDLLSLDVVQAIQDALSPAQACALTMYAEARAHREHGKGWVPNQLDAMVDVLTVIDNRVKDPRWSALGHKGVCLQRRQFSCWSVLGGLGNFYALVERAQWLIAEKVSEDLFDCLAAAEGCLAGHLTDTLSNATHYYAPASMVPPTRVPAWVAGATLTVERFGHRFYSHVK